MLGVWAVVDVAAWWAGAGPGAASASAAAAAEKAGPSSPEPAGRPAHLANKGWIGREETAAPAAAAGAAAAPAAATAAAPGPSGAGRVRRWVSGAAPTPPAPASPVTSLCRPPARRPIAAALAVRLAPWPPARAAPPGPPAVLERAALLGVWAAAPPHQPPTRPILLLRRRGWLHGGAVRPPQPTLRHNLLIGVTYLGDCGRGCGSRCRRWGARDRADTPRPCRPSPVAACCPPTCRPPWPAGSAEARGLGLPRRRDGQALQPRAGHSCLPREEGVHRWRSSRTGRRRWVELSAHPGGAWHRPDAACPRHPSHRRSRCLPLGVSHIVCGGSWVSG